MDARRPLAFSFRRLRHRRVRHEQHDPRRRDDVPEAVGLRQRRLLLRCHDPRADVRGRVPAAIRRDDLSSGRRLRRRRCRDDLQRPEQTRSLLLLERRRRPRGALRAGLLHRRRLRRGAVLRLDYAPLRRGELHTTVGLRERQLHVHRPSLCPQTLLRRRRLRELLRLRPVHDVARHVRAGRPVS